MFSTDKIYKYIDYILPLYFVISLPEMYLGAWGLFTISKYFAFVLLLFIATHVLKSNSVHGFSSLFTLFFSYCILSIVWYLGNGVSIKCYLNEVYNSLPAMFFFYIGMAEKREDNRFYKYFLFFCTACMLIGLFLYMTTPDWYMARRTELLNNQWYNSLTYKEEDVIKTMRFSSYLGSSYNVDFFALLAISVSLTAIYYSYKNSKSPLIAYVCLFINFAAAILSQMRVAMAYSVMALIFYIYQGKKHNSRIASSKLTAIFGTTIVIIITIGVAYLGDRGSFVTDLLTERLEAMSFSQAVGERNYQLKLLTDHWDMPIFGHGIGSGGSVARSMGYPAVSDCSYIELLYELGIVGFTLFATVLIKTVRRGLKYSKYYMTELVFIGFVMLACIGSNTLSMGFISTFPFWYCIGRIWNKSHFDYITNNNITI